MGVKQLLKKVLIGFLALGAIAALAVALFDPFTPLEKKIAVHVTPDDPDCESDHPVGVKLVNHSRSTVTDTAIEVIVRQVGYSNDLERERFDTDKIIEPGQDYSMCVLRPQSVRGVVPIPGVATDTYAEYPAERLHYSAEVLFAHSS